MSASDQNSSIKASGDEDGRISYKSGCKFEFYFLMDAVIESICYCEIPESYIPTVSDKFCILHIQACCFRAHVKTSKLVSVSLVKQSGKTKIANNLINSFNYFLGTVIPNSRSH